jgi:ankyrin repeat protein
MAIKLDEIYSQAIKGTFITAKQIDVYTNGVKSTIDNNTYKTPLHLAAERGDLRIVQKILEKSPEVTELQDTKKQTPLHLAAMNGHSDVVNAIFDAIKDELNEKEKIFIDGQNRFQTRGNLQVNFNELLNKTILEASNVKNKMGETALHIAARKGHSNVVMAILNKSPKAINVENETGKTALHIAANEGHTAVVKEILGKFPEAFNVKNNIKQTALDIAVSDGNLDVVKVILEKSPKEYIVKDNIGLNALNQAAIHGHSDIVTEILEKFPNFINSKNEERKTPMDYIEIVITRIKQNNHGSSDAMEQILNHLKQNKQGSSVAIEQMLNYLEPNKQGSSDAMVQMLADLKQKNPDAMIAILKMQKVEDAFKKQEKVRFDGTTLNQIGKVLKHSQVSDLGVLSTLSRKIDESKTIRWTKNLLNRRGGNSQGRS